MVFVNGLCDESARFYRVFEDLKASFGPSICPVVVPYIVDGQANIYINILEYKAYDYSGGAPVEVKMPDMGDRLEGLRTAIYEAVAETSDEMFEKYFSGEAFTPEEVIVGVSQGVKSGSITPVFCGEDVYKRQDFRKSFSSGEKSVILKNEEQIQKISESSHKNLGSASIL